MNAVAGEARLALCGVRIETCIIHFGMWDVTTLAEREDLRRRQGGRVADIFRNGVLNVLVASGVATGAKQIDISGWRAQRVRRAGQSDFVTLMAGQAGFIIGWPVFRSRQRKRQTKNEQNG